MASTLVIEDGTGVPGADSFTTLAECEAWSEAYYGAKLTGSTAVKDAAIRRAWFYLKSLPWKEEYPWPTLGGTIPEDVKTAQHMCARAEFITPDCLQPSVIPGQQKVLDRVGEIGWKVTGSSGVDAQRTIVTAAESLLKPYLAGKANFLMRA